MAKEASTEIDGVSFTLVTYGHDEGFDLLLTLAKIALPSVVDVIRSNPSLEALAAAFEANGGVEGLLQSVHLLPGRIQAEGGSVLLAKFFRGVFAVEDRKDDRGQLKPVKRRLSDSAVRDEVFGLRFGTTFRCLAWVIRENFAPFFSEVGAFLEQHSPKPAPAAQESETSDAQQ